MKTRIVLAVLSLVFIVFQLNSQEIRTKRAIPSQQDQNQFTGISSAVPGTPSGGGDISIASILDYRSDLGVKGGMFLKKDWLDGELILADGNKIEGWKFRYNIRFQQMQYTDGKDTLAFAIPSEIEMLKIGDKEFVYKEFQCDYDLSNGYFELLGAGSENKLLLRRVITHHIVDKKNDDPSDDTFIIRQSYYLKRGEQPAKFVLLSKKGFAAAFADKHDEVKAFIKKEKLKCKSPEDLLKVFDYYKTL